MCCLPDGNMLGNGQSIPFSERNQNAQSRALRQLVRNDRIYDAPRPMTKYVSAGQFHHDEMNLRIGLHHGPVCSGERSDPRMMR
jgi:class 3 adenylate cyclase